LTVTFTADGVRRGLRRVAPLALFAFPFGLAFGAAAVARGLSEGQAMVMSATVFAGASQFAALDLWDPPLPLLSIALVVLAVNARHMIFGAAMAPMLNAVPARRRWPLMAVLSDINFADTQAAFRQGERDAGVLLGGGIALWLSWFVGTAAGALGGAALGDLARFGFDVVMPTFFAAVVVGAVRRRADLLVLAISAAIAVAAKPVLPAGWNVLLAALVAAAAKDWMDARDAG
jgi:4-azaleucine resistance transporter AzlC